MNLERRHSDQLGKYNPLGDENLRAYFQNSAIQKHLANIGMISKDGKPISDAEFKQMHLKEENRTATQRLMAQQMFLKNRDFQLGRQLELQRQLEATQKVELYRKVKGSIHQENELMHMEPLDLERSFGKSNSANSLRKIRRTMSSSGGHSMPDDHRVQTSSEQGGRVSSGYHTDDDGENRISRSRKKNYLPGFKQNHMHRYLNDVSRFQQLHKLDPISLNSYKIHLQKELQQIKDARESLPQISPDTFLSGPAIPRSWSGRFWHQGDQTNSQKNTPENLYEYKKSLVRSVSTGNTLMSGRERKRGIAHSGNRNRSHSPYKQQVLPPLPKKNLSQKEKEKLERTFMTSAGLKKRRKNQPVCACFLQYLGSSSGATRDQGKWPQAHTIVIQQQHCGGNPITVFKEEMVPGTEFYFFSYRHIGYSFSLSFTEDGNVIQRVGTCCESRPAPKARLGGPQGAFRWLGVRNALPCYKCQVERELQAPYTNYEPKDKALLEKVIEKENLLASPHQRIGTTLPVAAGRTPVIRGKSGELKTTQNSASKGNKRLLITKNLVRETAGGQNEKEEKKRFWPKGLAATDKVSTPSKQAAPKQPKKVKKAFEKPKSASSSSSSSSDTESEVETSKKPVKKSSITNGKAGEESLKSYHSSSYSSSYSSGSESETDSKASKSKNESSASAAVPLEPKVVTVDAAEKKEEKSKKSSNSSTGSESSSSESESKAKPRTSTAVRTLESEQPPGTENSETVRDKKAGRKRPESAASKSSTGSSSSTMSGSSSGTGSSETPTSKISDPERRKRREERRKEMEKRNEDFGSRLQKAGSALLRLEERFDEKMKEVEESSRKPSEISAKTPDSQSVAGKSDISGAATENSKKSAEKLEEEAPESKKSESESESSSSESESETESPESESKASEASEKKQEETEKGSSNVKEESKKSSSSTSSEEKSETSAKKSYESQASKKESKAEVSDQTLQNDSKVNEDKEKSSESSSEEEEETETKSSFKKSVESNETTLNKESKTEVSELKAKPESKREESQEEEWQCKICNFENPDWAEKCRICQADKGEEASKSSSSSEESSETESEESKSSAGSKDENKKSDSAKSEEEKKKNSKEEEDEESDSSSSDTDTLDDAQSIKSQQEIDENLLNPAITVQSSTPSPRNAGNSTEKLKPRDEPDNVSSASDMSAANRILSRYGDVTPAAEESTKNEDSKKEEPESSVEEEGKNVLSKEMRKSCRSAEDVSLTGADLSAQETVARAGKLLAGNKNLKSLYLRNTGLTDDGVKVLAQHLQESDAPLKVLNLNMNKLTAKSIQPLIRLVKSKPIAILMLHDNQFKDYGLKELLTSLAESSDQVSLRRLDIGENDMGPKGANALSMLLRGNQSIKSLNLGGNKSLRPDDWEKISDGLLLNQSVESLNLDYCEMQDEGAQHLFPALKNKSNLKILDLDGNKLTDKTASQLLDVVRSCPNLNNVVLLAGNSISNEKMLTLRQILNAKNAKSTDEKDYLSVETSHYIKNSDLKA